jgi:hypothetical protein
MCSPTAGGCAESASMGTSRPYILSALGMPSGVFVSRFRSWLWASHEELHRAADQVEGGAEGVGAVPPANLSTNEGPLLG